jgi:protein-S-isoprenylcysteine O-methyltransferase Ste14
LHLLFQINKVDLVSLPQEIFARTFGWALSRRTVALAEVVTTLILGTAVQIKMLGARVEVEEKALREEFGEEYDEYCRKTWRFFPGW